MYKLIIVSFAFLIAVGCTKQRDTQFAQGQGENLLSVSDYNGKSFEIRTGAAIENKKQAYSKASDIEIKSEAVGKDSFSVVSYEVSDSLAKTLLGDTVIVGKPNMTYRGLIKVEQNYVKVYKVAKATDLPFNETTYAIKLDSGDLAVPLIGYPITSRVSIDNARNQYNEKSNTMIEKNEQQISSATHFRLDMSRGEIFEPVQKTDVLPASLFTGEWYYTETVIAAAEEESSSLGFTGGYDQTLQPSTRVKFLTNENSLKVVNLNIDERLTEKADVNFKTALTIPVSWKSYKVSSNGQGMSEQEDTRIHWSKRPNLEMRLDQATSFINNGRGRLVALEVKDNYFSFATEDAEGGRIRYSFLKAEKRDYTPKRLFKDDKRLFGFFETQKAVVNNFEISREEDVAKNIFISRFNPRGGKIVFNFTKTTPQWIRPSIRGAVAAWDKTFKDAGSSLDIVLDESKDVELGDLRYNAINIIENLTSSNLFGFGPSVTDPFTGEIISATTNVHLTPIREALISEIKMYIKAKLGLLDVARSSGISALLLSVNNLLIKQAGNTLDVASDYIPEMKGFKAYLPDSKNPNKYTLQNIDFRQRQKGKGREFDIAIASGNIHHEVEKQCSEIVEYINELKGKKLTHSDRENAVLDSCSRKMVVGKFMGTLVHEMGHNFGLRHNFMASNDVANFMSTDETKTETQVRSSSVMEYPSFNEDRLVTPGKYDIAAIRFGYADKVLVNDGRVIDLDVQKDIAQNMKSKNVNLHKFKFCTDEDVAYGTNPMCQRHDAGLTPLEVVKNTIADYQSSLQTYNYRLDSLYGVDPVRLQIHRMSRFFIPLFRFYEEWRTGLARYLGQEEQYLERLSEQDLNNVIAKMAKDPQYAEFVKQYKPTADAIFEFMMDVASTNNKYCVLSKKDNTLTLNELESVRQQMFFNKGQSVTSCADAASAGFWNSTGEKLVNESGHFLNSLRFDLSDKAAAEPLDVVGTLGDRMNAIMFLGLRAPLGYDARFRGFAPSFLDEPQYRTRVERSSLLRVINGLPGASLANDMADNSQWSAEQKAYFSQLKNDYLPKVSFPMFASESYLLRTMVESYRVGIQIPGKGEASMERGSFTNAIFVPQSQKAALEGAVATAHLGNGWFTVQSKSAVGAAALANKYNQLTALKNATPVDFSAPEAQKFIAEVTAALPTEAELKTITLEQLINKITPLSGSVSKLMESKNQDLLMAVQPVVGLLQVNEQIQAGLQSGDADKIKNMKEALAAPFSEIGPQIGLTTFPVKESFATDLNKKNAALKFYQENRKELDAQIDLLRNVMITILNN